MSTANTTDDKEQILEDDLLDLLPTHALANGPPISEAQEIELLSDSKESSPAPCVLGLGSDNVVNGGDSDQEPLDYEGITEDELDSSDIVRDPNVEDIPLPPNQQILFGPPEFYVNANSNAGDAIPSQDSANTDEDLRPKSALADETDGVASGAVAQILVNPQESEQIPTILAMLKKISDQLDTMNSVSVTHDDLEKYATKEDLEILATKTDLKDLAKTADIQDRVPSLDQWTEMIDRLAPIAALQGMSTKMGLLLEELSRIALDQRRLSRSQGKGQEKVDQLLKQRSIDWQKFEDTSLKITRVYDSLRSYIARKVSSLETDKAVKDLSTQLVGIKRDQDSFKKILEPGVSNDDSVLIALDEIDAISTTAEGAQSRKTAEKKEQEFQEARKNISVKCFYCHGAHDAAWCNVYFDLHSRRQALISEHRCLLCGKEDCDSSPANCKARNRLCVRCGPSMSTEEREHHPLLCPNRQQKKVSSLVGEDSKAGHRSDTARKDEYKSDVDMDKYLDPSRPRQDGRYVVLPKYVTGHSSDCSSCDEQPSKEDRALAPSSSNRPGSEPSKKPQRGGGYQWQRRGAKHRSSGKREDAKRPRLAHAAKSEKSIKKEPGANH